MIGNFSAKWSKRTILRIATVILLLAVSTYGSKSTVISAVSIGTFDSTWFTDNCPGGQEAIVNAILQTRESTPGGDDSNYGFCTAQRGTFPWDPGTTVGTALPSGIVSVSVTFNFLDRILLSGSRYHIYVALYYRLPGSIGNRGYQWLDTQVRVENIDGVDSPLGSTETYDPTDSYGWDIVTLQASPAQSGLLTADVAEMCLNDLIAWGLPPSTQCILQGLEIGTEGYHIQELDVDWPTVTLVTSPFPAPLADFSFSPSPSTVGQPVSFTGTASGGTPPYRYSWDFGDGDSGTGQVVTHAYSAVGDYYVTLNVTDSLLHMGETSRTVTVLPPPDFTLSVSPPALTIQIGRNASSTVAISSENGFSGTVSITPATNNGLTVWLSAESAVLTDGSTQTLTLTIIVPFTSGPGPYSASVSGLSGTLQHSANISVLASTETANNPPPLTAPASKSTTIGTLVEFVVSATDPDPGQSVTFTAEGLPTGSSFDPATGYFSWTPAPDQAGTYTVMFTATDDGSPPKSDTKSVVIEVAQSPPVQPPHSLGTCPLCQIADLIQTNWLLFAGLVAGVVISLIVVYLRVRGRLAKTRKSTLPTLK